MGAAEATGRELLGRFTPGGIGLVVDDMIGAEFLERFGFGVGGSGSNDAGAGGLGELEY